MVVVELAIDGGSDSVVFCGFAALFGGGIAALLLYFWDSGSDVAAGQGAGPSRGQVWWADVPYEEQVGSKKRPVLVLTADATHVWCLFFTSVDQSRNRNYIPAPASMWAKPKEHSYLKLDRPLTLARSGVTQYQTDAPMSLCRQADKWATDNPGSPGRPSALPSAEPTQRSAA
jgi:hypothetical protein